MGLGLLADGDDAFRAPPHLQLIDDALLDVAAGKCPRLAIFLPPRHFKSTTCSRTFPAWFTMRFPNKRVMLASYEAMFAARWGARAREIVLAHGPDVFGVTMADDGRRAMSAWELTNGSEMVTTGVGGSLTGRGADVLIIDDPVKNAEQAHSEVYRDKTWDWYVSTAYTRLEPGGSVVLVMTRWHEDDLAGRILRKEGEDWRVIELPALCDSKDDPLGRDIGAALDPGRYDVPELEAIRAELGSYWFTSLYQQHPTAPEGSLFKREWVRYWTELPKLSDMSILQSWDLTFDETTGGSFVSGQVWGKHVADRYLLDEFHKRVDFPKTIDAIRVMSAKWPSARVKLVEKKANGAAAISTLKREIAGMVPVEPHGSKITRATSVTPEWESGNVYVPDPSLPGHGWSDEYVAEVLSFPHGRRDDRVDSMVHALRRFSGVGSTTGGFVAR